LTVHHPSIRSAFNEPARSRAVLAALGLVLTVLAACSGTRTPTQQELDLRVGFGVAAGPVREHATRVLLSNLYVEALLRLDWNGRPVARLAESWQWKDDGHLLVLRIREGVKFHDGALVTSRSIIPRLEAYRRSRMAEAGYIGGFTNVTAIETTDERTVAIRLRQPDTFLLDDIPEVAINAEHDREIGTGAFKIVQRDPPAVQRFDAYYGGPPAIRTVSLVPFDSQRSAWAALLRGDIDVVQEVERDAVEFIEGSTQVKTYTSLHPFYIAFVFNLRHRALGNVEVRRALSEAIDRDEIIRDALRGYAEPAFDPIWPAHWAYGGAKRRYAHDPAAARDRLERAGLAIQPAAGGRMASRIRLNCLFAASEPQFERIALMLQRQLARVGVDLVLTGVPLNEAIPAAGSGKFDTVLLPIRGGTSISTAYGFWRSRSGEGTLLNSGYTGADAILDHLRTVRSDAEIRAAVADLQQRFHEDAPAVFLAWQQTTRAVDARIDVSDDPEPDVFRNIQRWRPAATPVKAGR
jgi:peptide/nickel transport system substrate-binding protein